MKFDKKTMSLGVKMENKIQCLKKQINKKTQEFIKDNNIIKEKLKELLRK